MYKVEAPRRRWKVAVCHADLRTATGLIPSQRDMRSNSPSSMNTMQARHTGGISTSGMAA
jgi:hypothetical protein